jgi:hypothetical protein
MDSFMIKCHIRELFLYNMHVVLLLLISEYTSNTDILKWHMVVHIVATVSYSDISESDNAKTQAVIVLLVSTPLIAA